jgi:hydroxyethylthiazole kinase-like uncharacterized protein yjeF
MNPFYPIFDLEAARSYETGVLGNSDEALSAALNEAGRAIGHAIPGCYGEYKPWPEQPRLLLLAGKGLNAADGVVAALELAERHGGLSITLVETEPEADWHPLLAKAVGALSGHGGVLSVSRRGIDAFLQEPGASAYDVILDGIYGMGFRGQMAAGPARLIEAINAETGGGIRIAIDLPSGLGAEGAHEPTFKADVTLVPGVVKAPLFHESATGYVGRIRFLELATFSGQTVPEGIEPIFGAPQAFKGLGRLRPAVSDKRDNGHVLIFAGSNQMPGAALMATLAALQSGAGLVTTFTPSNIVKELVGMAPEAMWRPLPLTMDGGIDVEAVKIVAQLAPRADAILIGPGLLLDKATLYTVCRIVRETPLPLVLDASVLTQDVMSAVLARTASGGPTVATPHEGEYLRMHGFRETSTEPEQMVDFCRRTRMTVVHKGVPTRIVNGDRHVLVPSGGPVLARGGSGDILAGILTTLLAQKPDDPLMAALQAVTWHGAAANALAEHHGATAVRTTDLLNYLGAVLR